MSRKKISGVEYADPCELAKILKTDRKEVDRLGDKKFFKSRWIDEKKWYPINDSTQRFASLKKDPDLEPISPHRKAKKKKHRDSAEEDLILEPSDLKLKYEALSKKAQYEVLIGSLVPVQEIKNQIFKASRALRDSYMGLPDRLAPELVSMDDQDEIHAALTKEIHSILEGFSETEQWLIGNTEDDSGRPEAGPDIESE